MTLRNCECIVLEPLSANSSEAIESLRTSSHAQGVVQLILSSISVGLLCLYLSLYALAPRRMWRYPLSLAFWIYVCDFFVALQFVLVSSAVVRYTHGDEASLSARQAQWPITSNSDCLCDFSPDHPGCACRNGILSFMLQAGLLGSTAFYACLSHNLFRSVADPFTRPSSRLWHYHRLAWVGTLGVSITYLIPQRTDADKWTGFGARGGRPPRVPPLRVRLSRKRSRVRPPHQWSRVRPLASVVASAASARAIGACTLAASAPAARAYAACAAAVCASCPGCPHDGTIAPLALPRVRGCHPSPAHRRLPQYRAWQATTTTTRCVGRHCALATA